MLDIVVSLMAIATLVVLFVAVVFTESIGGVQNGTREDGKVGFDNEPLEVTIY